MEAEDPIEMKEVAADLAARDERDCSRRIAPLRAADDAICLDTSGLDRDAVIAAAIGIAENRLSSRQMLQGSLSVTFWQTEHSTVFSLSSMIARANANASSGGIRSM